MQQDPLLKTKLHIPPVRPELVSRPRLVERLNAGMHRKLTLVSAPAGFGKTTIIAEWLSGQRLPQPDPSPTRRAPALPAGEPAGNRKSETCPGRIVNRVAWLSLDNGDNDPVRFLTYLIAALQAIEGNVGQGLVAALLSSGTANVEAVLTTLINEIAGIPNRLFLILDDYHLIESQAVDSAITYLLEHLPPPPGGLHLVIASRIEPSLPLSRLRARGQLAELRQDDLRFSASEAAAFFKRVVGLPIAPEHVRALEDRTEGWITGLQLAAVALQGLGHRDQINDFVQSFSGSHRYVIDYLVDEVLAQQTAEVQAFLSRTSILERMSGSLCNTILGQEESQATLERLEAANLFVIPLDGERLWYRYHHLFADLLGQRLRHTELDQVPILHSRASEWYAQHGFRNEAVHHAIAGGDFSRAADLIEAWALSQIGQGAFTTVQTWIDSVPGSMVRQRPYLCVYHAWASNFLHQLDAIEPCLLFAQQALQRQELPADGPVAMDVQGQIATLRAWNARRQRDNAQAIGLLTEAIACLGDGNPWARTFASLNLGLAHMDDGALIKAADAFGDSVSQGVLSENELASFMATSHLASILILQGRLHEAAALCRRTIQDELERHGKPRPTLFMVYLRLGWVLCEWNDVDGFYANLSQAVILAEQMGYDSVVKVGALTMAWEQTLLAEQGTVVELSEEVAAIVDRALAAERAANGSPHLPQHDTGIAEIETQNVVVYNSDDAYFEIWPGYSEHSRAKQLAEDGKVAEALDLLASIYESAQAVEGKGLMLEARSMEALICQSQGDLDRALDALADALALGEPEGYIRSFADRGAPMADLLQKAAARGTRPEYVARLLAAFGGTTEAGGRRTNRAESPLVEPLSQRELEVLELVAQGLSNREIGERLFLALNTVKGHNRRIYGKLGVSRRTEAVARARELNLI